MRGWLSDNLRTYDSTDPIGLVAIEAPIVMHSKTNQNSMLWLHGAHTVVRMVTHEFCVPLAVVNVSHWRQFLIGQPRAPKSVPAKDRRKWLKQAVITECQKQGFETSDDNAADAVGIAIYVQAQLANGIDMGEAA